MRIFFMGTSSFAVPSLRALLASGHEVVGVVTQPDRPAGRGRQLRLSPVKEAALEAGVPIHQPERVRNEGFIVEVRRLSPDALVVAAFGQIIPKAILDIPKFGGVNVHASLLPKYRGAAPVHHALMGGETHTGVTSMLMDPGLDTGPILLQREVEINPDENEGMLEARLAEVGAGLLMETFDRLERGEVTPVPQDDSLASYAPSVKREECEVNWEEDAVTIANRVRGCTPRPGAYTYWQGVPLKVWACRAVECAPSSGRPGEVLEVEPEGIIVRAGKGGILLTEVQPENRKRMPAPDFARGQRIGKGAVLK